MSVEEKDKFVAGGELDREHVKGMVMGTLD